MNLTNFQRNYKTAILLAFVILLSCNTTLPSVSTKHIISPVTIDPNFVDTLTFNSKWEYPWYIVVDDEGHFETALGDSINKSDTIHLYHTANCVTNHQGEHSIRYCDGKFVNDSVKLIFLPELPAYASSLCITIKNNNFWCDFSAVYPQYIQGEKLSWTINTQKLIMDTASYNPGDTIKGYIEVNFTETSTIPNKKPNSRDFYFKGFFKTQLTKNE
jgi:hypothetical protein